MVDLIFACMFHIFYVIVEAEVFTAVTTKYVTCVNDVSEERFASIFRVEKPRGTSIE
jgi:hypothetical protein